MGRRLALTIALSVAAAASVIAAQATRDTLPGVTNYTRVEAAVGCGGATTTEAFPALKQEGFRAVINLRQADEKGADVERSKQAAEAAGLRYLHIPVNGANPQAESVDQFLAAVKDPANSPVYIHCASANRVGAVWLVKRVLVDGWDVEKATAEAERIGLTSDKLKQFALDYLKARGKSASTRSIRGAFVQRLVFLATDGLRQLRDGLAASALR